MSIRPKIETALAATAERLSPGSGPEVVRHLKNDLATIDASSENLSRRYANDDVAVAVPAIFEAKHPEGDPVTVGKRHEGLIVAFSDSLVFVRGVGFGAREVKALSKNEVSVEKVTMVLDGVNVPGLRVADRGGRPQFAVAVALPDHQSELTAQEALRDEICALFAG
jgi:hypothetical protein